MLMMISYVFTYRLSCDVDDDIVRIYVPSVLCCLTARGVTPTPDGRPLADDSEGVGEDDSEGVGEDDSEGVGEDEDEVVEVVEDEDEEDEKVDVCGVSPRTLATSASTGSMILEKAHQGA